jgi:hypothetical protein
MYATQYSEIPTAFASEVRIRDRALLLVSRELMPGKATEGGDRLNQLRDLLTRVIEGKITPSAACTEVERTIPRENSVHALNNRVFPTSWGERLIRTQVSRLYNQAVLELALEDGIEEVFVPHSSEEEGSSACTQFLAGGRHRTRELLDRLVQAYSQGDFGMKEPKVPHHPHCTHVVVAA